MAKRKGRDRRTRNKGVSLTRLVGVRSQVVESQAPKQKTYKTNAGAKAFAKAQLATNGVRYEVFDVGTKRKPEFDAVRVGVYADDVQRSSSFRGLMNTLKSARSRKAGGKLARALEQLGLRDVGATWPVGES